LIKTIRWLAFLPIAVLASMIAGVLAHKVTTLLVDWQWLAWIVNGTFAGATFCVVGQRIAPKGPRTHRIVAGALMTIGALSAAGDLTSDEQPERLLASIAICVCAYQVFRLSPGWNKNAGESSAFVVSTEPITDRGADDHALIGAYGAAIGEHAEGGGVVSDVRKLPTSKSKLRAALLRLIKSSDDAEQAEYLRNAYLLLAEFQPDVGSQVIEIDSIQERSDVSEEAARIAKQVDACMRWQTLVLDESGKLAADLTKLPVSSPR